MYPVLIVSFKVHAFIIGVNICICPSALTQTTYQRDIGLTQLHMFVIKLVQDLCPPFFVILALNKLLKLVLFGQLCHFFTFDCVALVVI